MPNAAWQKLQQLYADLPEQVTLGDGCITLTNPSRTDRIHEVYTSLQSLIFHNAPNDWDVTLTGHWTPDSGRIVLEFDTEDNILMMNYKFGVGAQVWIAGHWTTLRTVTGKPQRVVFRQRTADEPALHHHWDDCSRVKRYEALTCPICSPPAPATGAPPEAVELSW